MNAVTDFSRIPQASVSHEKAERNDGMAAQVIMARAQLFNEAAVVKQQMESARQQHRSSLTAVHSQLNELVAKCDSLNFALQTSQSQHAETHADLAEAKETIKFLQQRLSTEQSLRASAEAAPKEGAMFQEHFRKVAEADAAAEQRSELATKGIFGGRPSFADKAREAATESASTATNETAPSPIVSR
jgi:chromosome segregation ATPase